MLKDDCNIERCDVLRGSFMILKFSNFKEAGFFDCSTFLYFEEDKLCKKMEEKHFYRGIVKNIFYIHNHPYKKATIKATMVRHRRYYSSMLDYSKRYISKNVFLIFVLRVAICIGLFEKFLYTIFKSIFVQEKN